MLSKSSDSMLTAKIGFFDLFLLLVMWVIVFLASIKSFGSMPAVAFILLNIILVLRNTSNGILVMLLIFYAPATSLVGLPIGPFSLAFIVITIKYFFSEFMFGSKWLLFNDFLLIAIIFILYITLTVFIAPDMDLALYYYQKYIEGLIVLILLFGTVTSKEKLGRVFRWWAIVAALSLFIKLAHVYFGVDAALFKILERVDVSSTFDLEHRTHINIKGESVSRLIWPGEEPNYTATSMIFPFAIALAFFNASKGIGKGYWMVLLCMIGVIVVGTYSRSGFISIVAVLGLFTLKNNKKSLVPAVLISGILMALIFSIPQLHDRIFSIGSEVQGQGSGRFYLWHEAIGMWLNSPLWGNGLSAYYSKMKVAAHNTFLQMLAEIGIIGLGLFLWLLFKSILTGYKIKKLYPEEKHGVVLFLQILLMGLIGMTMMINTVTYQDIKLYWMVCGICVAMFYVADKEHEDTT